MYIYINDKHECIMLLNRIFICSDKLLHGNDKFHRGNFHNGIFPKIKK